MENETNDYDYTYYYNITDDDTIGHMFDGDNTTEWFTDYDFEDQVKTVNVEFHVSTNIWVDDSIRDPRTRADPHQKKYST